MDIEEKGGRDRYESGRRNMKLIKRGGERYDGGKYEK
jgi:hypothetical protein